MAATTPRMFLTSLTKTRNFTVCTLLFHDSLRFFPNSFGNLWNRLDKKTDWLLAALTTFLRSRSHCMFCFCNQLGAIQQLMQCKLDFLPLFKPVLTTPEIIVNTVICNYYWKYQKIQYTKSNFCEYRGINLGEKRIDFSNLSAVRSRQPWFTKS